MALIEIVVSMVVLAVAALAVTATVSMVNSKQMRSAGGSSLDLQALSYARQTLDGLKSAVSTDTTGHAKPLIDKSYGASCAKPAGEPCGSGTSYVPVASIPAVTNEFVDVSLAIPDSDLKTHGGVRSYKVWDISGGSGTVAYKKVTDSVTWAD